MIERQKRLKEVYDHLRKYFGVHTQTDFADAIKYSRPVISSALNGNEDYLTDKLFKNICEAYPDVFDIDYLLNGTGQLLTIREEVTTQELEKQFNPQQSYADELIASLKKQVKDKDETIALLRGQIEILQSTIATKNDMIELLQRQIEDLRHQLSILREQETLKDFPFSTRASEPRSEPRK